LSILSALSKLAGSAASLSTALYGEISRSDTTKQLKEKTIALRGRIEHDVSPLLKDAKVLLIKDAHYCLDQLEHTLTTLPDQAPQLPRKLTDSVAVWEQQCQVLIKTRVDPLFGGKRESLMQELQSGEHEELTFTPEERQLNRNLTLAGIVTGASVVTAPISAVLSFAVCVPIAMYLIHYTAQAAYRSLKEERKLSIPVLMTANQLMLWFGGYFTLGGIILIFSFAGQKLGYITYNHSRKQLSDVFGKLPPQALVLRDGVEQLIPFGDLMIGDVLVANAGQTIPVDGVIVDGYASIDQHRLTGEAQPAEKGIGDSVLASTMVLSGRAHVRVEKSGNGTLAARIGEMLQETASYEMALTTRARQMADQSVAPTLAMAALAGVVVGLPGAIAITSTIFGLNLMFCGPLALRNYLSVAVKKGILIKDGRSLDLLKEIDTVVFDKTGTLTLEQPHVAAVYSFSEVSSPEILRYASAVEQHQSHPIARAILTHAREQNVAVPEIDEAHLEMGYGLRAEIESRLIHVGSERYMTLEKIALPPYAEYLQSACHEQGDSLVLVAVDGQLAGAIALKPTIRPEAKAVIDELRRRKLEVCIISGDHEGPTSVLAKTLGIDRYFANTLPEDKARLVEKLQQDGRSVCFVGDGINDSIALKKANVSVSLHGATTVAIDTAQIVLLDTTLEQLPTIFRLADEIAGNLRAAQALAVVPALGIWTGVFVFHLGILGAALIFESSLWLGIANAFRPLVRYKEESGETAQPQLSLDQQAQLPV